MAEMGLKRPNEPVEIDTGDWSDGVHLAKGRSVPDGLHLVDVTNLVEVPVTPIAVGFA